MKKKARSSTRKRESSSGRSDFFRGNIIVDRIAVQNSNSLDAAIMKGTPSEEEKAKMPR